MLYPEPFQNENATHDEVAKLQISVRALREQNERLITKLAEMHRCKHEFDSAILAEHLNVMKSAIGLVLYDNGMRNETLSRMLLMFIAKYHQIVAELNQQEEIISTDSKSIAA